ncbi:LysR family transcriptional regulator [Actinotignum sp. GS-2025c]|uniref:LysR family transcriptional regulator n=1 Tax=Actinotignum sp. GS-2025c TaxID=3427276 RepID=UPI002A8AFFFE|nr:LysR family transcriptional regulator [Actinotignum timonense]
MRLELLETLVSYSRLGTMDAVARQCGCTTAAVVKRIQLLEEEVGYRLTQRAGRGSELTPAGWHLVERSTQILGLVDKTVSEIRDAVDDPQGRVVIVGRESAALESLATVMGRVRQRYPGISFELRACGREQAARMLAEGGASFAVLDASWECESWETLALPGEDRWGLLTRSGSDLAGRESVRRADITKRALLLPSEGSRELGYWLDKENQLDVVGRYGSGRVACRLVEAGVGEAIVLENAVVENAVGGENRVLSGETGVSGAGLVFVPLDWLVGLRCVLAWSKQARLGRAGEVFVETARAAFAGEAVAE